MRLGISFDIMCSELHHLVVFSNHPEAILGHLPDSLWCLYEAITGISCQFVSSIKFLREMLITKRNAQVCEAIEIILSGNRSKLSP